MIPDDPELRRALQARSGSLPPGFAARLGAALRVTQPRPRLTPIVAASLVVTLCGATIGLLVYARYASTHVRGTASGPRISTPSPSESPLPMPNTAVIDAPSHDVVWVLVGDDHLYRSTDRGTHWERRPMPPVPGRSFSFIDDHEGWFLEAGSPATQCQAEVSGLWHTVDAGKTWQHVQMKGVAEAQCKEFVSFDDSRRGFLTAWDPNHRPTIYRSVDGGLTWSGGGLPDPPGFVSADAGFTLRAGVVEGFGKTLLVTAAGMNQSTQDVSSVVFRSVDGGATWSYAARIPNAVFAVGFVSEVRWLQVVTPGQSAETSDAGKSWHPYPSDYDQAAPVSPQVVFGDASVGYATVRGSIQRTDDGGLHWTYITTPGVVQPG